MIIIGLKKWGSVNVRSTAIIDGLSVVVLQPCSCVRFGNAAPRRISEAQGQQWAGSDDVLDHGRGLGLCAAERPIETQSGPSFAERRTPVGW